MNIIFRNFKQSSSKIQLQRDVLLFEPCENSKFDPFLLYFPLIYVYTLLYYLIQYVSYYYY